MVFIKELDFKLEINVFIHVFKVVSGKFIGISSWTLLDAV